MSQRRVSESRLEGELLKQKSAANLLKKQYWEQYRELDNKKYSLNNYEKKLMCKEAELQYLKNNRLIRCIRIWFSYLYLIFKSHSSDLATNIKLFNVLKNSDCFDIGYYLTANPEIKKSIFCRYLIPELHYVVYGFDEKRKFNFKDYNCQNKRLLLNIFKQDK